MITTQDIRNAYTRIHGLTLANMKEFERLGLLTADQYSAEDLSLPIDEFMVKVGFANDKPPGYVEMPDIQVIVKDGFIHDNSANKLISEEEIMRICPAPLQVKRPYSKRVK